MGWLRTRVRAYVATWRDEDGTPLGFFERARKGSSSVEYAMLVMMMVTGMVGFFNNLSACIGCRAQQAAAIITNTDATGAAWK